MSVKARKFSLPIVSQLSDWELIIAYSYCKRLLDPQNPQEIEDFEDLSFFFFEGETKITSQVLGFIKKMYIEEYEKRRCN